MAMQPGALREALLDAGARPAEEIAGDASEFATIRTDWDLVLGQLRVLRWMLGTNLALLMVIALKVFTR